MKRTIFIFVFIFSGLMAALFLFRLQIGTFLLTKALELAGAEKTHLELTVFNSSEMRFSTINCTLPGDKGNLSLRNTVLTWNHTTLSQKRLDVVSIHSLTLELPLKNTPAESGAKISVEKVIKRITQLRQRLPFRDLRIRHLNMHGQSAGLLADRDLALTLQYHDSGLTGELVLNNQDLRLSFESSQPGHWRLGVHAPGLSKPFFTAQLQWRDRMLAEISTDLSLLDKLEPLLNKPLPKMAGMLSGTLSSAGPNTDRADLVLDLQQFSFADLTAASATLTLQGRMVTPEKFLLKNNSTLNISTLKNKDISLGDLTLNLGGTLEKNKGSQHYTLEAKAILTALNLNNSGLKIDSIHLSPSINGRFSGRTISLNLQPGKTMQLTGIQAASLKCAKAVLENDKETKATVTFQDQPTWKATPSGWLLTTDTLHVQNLSIQPAPVRINVQQLNSTPQGSQIRARLSSPGLVLTTPDIGIPLRDFFTEFTADSDHIRGSATFSPETIPGILAIQFLYNLKNGRGQATVNSEQPFSFSEIAPLSSLLDQWPTAFDLTGGQLQLKSSINRRPGHPLQVTLQADLSEGKGNYKKTLFSGLAIRQDLQLLPTIQSLKDGFITIDTVETGITVQDIAMKTACSPSPHGKFPQIILRDLSASLFGGTVSDKLLIYDPQKPEVQSTLRLNNIDLARLITIQQVKGLEIEGRIRGNLPFLLDDNGLRIEEGTMHSIEPGGVIRYTSPAANGLKESPLTGYALKALEDFRYTLLSATAEYTPDGELQVSFHLEGKSPKLETDRPVHFNINTEQNLLSLLKSLRYSKSLTDEIDKEVQQHYQNPVP